MRHSKLEIWPCLKAISSTIYSGSWQLILKLRHNM